MTSGMGEYFMWCTWKGVHLKHSKWQSHFERQKQTWFAQVLIELYLLFKYMHTCTNSYTQCHFIFSFYGNILYPAMRLKRKWSFIDFNFIFQDMSELIEKEKASLKAKELVKWILVLFYVIRLHVVHALKYKHNYI